MQAMVVGSTRSTTLCRERAARSFGERGEDAMAGKLDLDLDLDPDLGGRPGSGGGPRYNSDDFPRMIPAAFPPAIPVPTKDYSLGGWDPELRAWGYVEEFIASYVAPNTAVSVIRAAI